MNSEGLRCVLQALGIYFAGARVCAYEPLSLFFYLSGTVQKQNSRQAGGCSCLTAVRSMLSTWPYVGALCMLRYSQ